MRNEYIHELHERCDVRYDTWYNKKELHERCDARGDLYVVCGYCIGKVTCESIS